MNNAPPILLPADLLPSDGRFGSGPSRVPSRAMSALGEAADGYMGTSHRQPTVKNVVASVREGLSDLYVLPDGYEVVLGIGGATAFWDAAAFGLIRNRSSHFVCGEFSSKFAAVTTGAPHLGEPVVVATDPGTAPEPQHVEDVDAAAYIHNETSTGVVARWERFEDEIVLVDATSAAGAITIDPGSVDAYYFSPQKALGSEGALWVALLSPSAVDRIGEIASMGRWIPPFLSLQTALDNSVKQQTYNTPALATLFLLERQITHLNENGGLAAAEAISRASSDHLYSWATASSFAEPFVAESGFRSPTVVTIDLRDDIEAAAVSGHLRANGIVDTESYRKLGRNQLRIATFPTIPTADVVALAGCIDFIVEAM